MRLKIAMVLFPFLAGFSFAQSNSAPASPAFNASAIDKNADPCTDFYAYACGNWMKTNTIPADQASWLSFRELDDRNEAILRQILEKAEANGPHRSAIDQKIGDFYDSCMDESAANAKGLDPLKPELARIAGAKDKQALIDAIARVQLLGPNPLFSFYSSPALHNANMVIVYLDQGGLTLPDRDYYIKDDAHMNEIRQHYREYVTQVFTLAGQSPEQAKASAETVLRIETELAKAAMDRTARRDPKTRDHKMTLDEASTMASNFYLTRYFSDMGTPKFTDLNVSNPEFSSK